MHGRLAASGFRVRPLVEFQRPVDTSAGTGTAAFTVARVEPGEMPQGRIQALTHHTESMVWQPRWLSHPNGALGLTIVTIVVADVSEAAARFARFTARQAIPGTHSARGLNSIVAASSSPRRKLSRKCFLRLRSRPCLSSAATASR